MHYRTLSHSVHGKKYIDLGWPCQDYSGQIELNNLQVIAIADGHGSNDCFRSQIGSMLAVRTILNQAKNAFSTLEFNNFDDTTIRYFKHSIWTKWREEVRHDWDTHLLENKTLGENECRYNAVSDKYKNRYASADSTEIEKYLYHAYGTTLICAISISKQVLLLQVGDGTCVVMDGTGEFSTPLPPDEDNFLNVSFSLCDVNEYNADAKIRHAVLDCENNELSPVAIFLSSDGLDDCYPYEKNEQYLYKYVYSTMIKYILDKGYSFTAKEIREKLLPTMTEKVSKDDISLACMITDDNSSLIEAYKGTFDFLNTLDIEKEEKT